MTQEAAGSIPAGHPIFHATRERISIHDTDKKAFLFCNRRDARNICVIPYRLLRGVVRRPYQLARIRRCLHVLRMYLPMRSSNEMELSSRSCNDDSLLDPFLAIRTNRFIRPKCVLRALSRLRMVSLAPRHDHQTSFECIFASIHRTFGDYRNRLLRFRRNCIFGCR